MGRRLRRNPWVQDELGLVNRTPAQHATLEALPEGYFAEWPIDVPPAWRARGAPFRYWVDIANPRTKVAIELDDLSHHRPASVAKDALKDQVLRSMGWTIRRVQTGQNPAQRQNPARRRPEAAPPRRAAGTRRRTGTPSTIQTLLFPVETFSVSTAKVWAKAHGFNASNEDILVPSRTGGKYIHIRQQDPKQGQGLRWVTYTLDKVKGIRATAFVRAAL